ncbi:MAG: hypothetical protein GY874_18135 [Desulfobacteraceae bacterium]|nr:hypothetical protein [Desulfobacteraceae bacterium]
MQPLFFAWRSWQKRAGGSFSPFHGGGGGAAAGIFVTAALSVFVGFLLGPGSHEIKKMPKKSTFIVPHESLRPNKEKSINTTVPTNK